MQNLPNANGNNNHRHRIGVDRKYESRLKEFRKGTKGPIVIEDNGTDVIFVEIEDEDDLAFFKLHGFY